MLLKIGLTQIIMISICQLLVSNIEDKYLIGNGLLPFFVAVRYISFMINVCEIQTEKWRVLSFWVILI